MSKAMSTCDQLKEALVATGRAAIEQNADFAEHLRTCAECQRLLHAWAQIPDLLEQLPQHEPDESLVRKISKRLATPGGKAIPGRRRFLAPSLASAAVLLAAIGLSRELLLHEAPKVPVTTETPAAPTQSLGGPDTPFPSARMDHIARNTEEQTASNRPRPDEHDQSEESRDYRGNQNAVFASKQKTGEREGFDRFAASDALSDGEISESEPVTGFGDEIRVHRSAAAPDAERKLNNERHAGSSSVSELRPNTPLEQLRHDQAVARADSEDADDLKKSTDKNRRQRPADEGTGVRLEVELASENVAVAKTESARKELGQLSGALSTTAEMAVAGGAGGYAPAKAAGQKGSGFDFLGHYQQTERLQFQPASGYWANTYIPGDPEIRWLNARLAQWDRSWLPNHGDLEQSVTPVEQPYDAPDDNALSLSLMADANAIAPGDSARRPTRLRLQVGIHGIEHRRGQRPAMNVGLVIDLPADAPDAVRIASRALLDAMLQSKQAGDQFSLVVTGQPGLIVTADDFRFGPLQLARQIILGQDSPQASGDGAGPVLSPVDLYGAIEHAGNMLQQNDDPSRPLGSSAVVLISARETNQLDRLLALTHRHAKAGITLSVFPLGEQAQRSQADKLALAGLGNRRFLEAPKQARQLIEEELHASSRAVARAARLSIRLAPGVKLIGVVGSERLDLEQAQQVRDIENSMDHRLSTNLGIQADRGVDEDGIQILIPTIYSADSVTVLVDVVTDRPGAIADVSLRYKDLVFLRNGSLQSHLELPEGELERGPAELTVLKNLLSHHFVVAVRQAADAVGRRQAGEAANILGAMRATIENVRQKVPAWGQDPDLIRDQQVLDQYISALASPEAGAHRSFLTDSLQYAAWAKTHRGLEEWK